ncbi:MAG: peptidylprolyl isomerase [Rudaea sp.]|uniref:peptidylprolyl isomerase n=1 Tax=Rudaea sp. TaxID=2136325 RepID=UPI0039E300B2
MRTLIALVLLAAAPLAQAQAPATKPVTKPAVPAAAAKPVEPAALPQVVLHTTQGEITLELRPDKAPKSVDNFLAYVKDGFYDGTIVDRVIPGFLVQGGRFTRDMQQKRTRQPIANEANNGLPNLKYTIAVARNKDDPLSGSSGWFINLVDNKRLDFTAETNGLTWGYAVFGKVIKGQNVIDKIAALPTGAAGPLKSDVPTTQVVIEKAELVP